VLRAAASTDDRVYFRLSTQRNDAAVATVPDGRLHILRDGTRDAPLVVAVGPMLKPVLEATDTLDATVAYTNTPRPLDTATLRRHLGQDLVLVEPYLAGTSAATVARALSDRPHRVLHLGVNADELRRYGSPKDHARWHGLDAEGLRRAIETFVSP
jgi:transketolase